MTQDNHFTLIFRKSFQHFTNTVMTLSFDHGCFSAVIRKIQHLENVFVFAVADSWGTLYFPEMIHTKVVCNTHSPGKEFSFFCIAAAPHSINDADKHILENIFEIGRASCRERVEMVVVQGQYRE